MHMSSVAITKSLYIIQVQYIHVILSVNMNTFAARVNLKRPKGAHLLKELGNFDNNLANMLLGFKVGISLNSFIKWEHFVNDRLCDLGVCFDEPVHVVEPIRQCVSSVIYETAENAHVLCHRTDENTTQCDCLLNNREDDRLVSSRLIFRCHESR